MRGATAVVVLASIGGVAVLKVHGQETVAEHWHVPKELSDGPAQETHGSSVVGRRVDELVEAFVANAVYRARQVSPLHGESNLDQTTLGKTGPSQLTTPSRGSHIAEAALRTYAPAHFTQGRGPALSVASSGPQLRRAYWPGRQIQSFAYQPVKARAETEIKLPPRDGTVRVRFAPSPTGNLHVGGARTALFNWLYAKHNGGKFILRVEDTDTARSTRESEDAVVRDLKWLGLDWDEGPDVGGEYGPYRQSERGQVYKYFADKLVAEGYAYPCFCTEEELAKMKEESPVYTGKWAHASPEEVQEMLDKGVPHTYRFRVPKGERVEIDDLVRGKVGWDTDTLGDFVLLRSNGMPVYNFCVAVDDATMGITHVLRAEEHLANTLRQALVYQALKIPMPAFGHMSLILAPDKSKLSKRHGATSVGDFKEQGYLPETMVNYLSLLGWNEGTDQELYKVAELVDKFSIERIVRSAAVFDKTKLKWMNGEYFKAMQEPQKVSLIGAALVDAGIAKPWKKVPSAFCTLASLLVLDKVELPEDAVPEIAAALSYPLEENIKNGKLDKVLEDQFGEIADAIVKGYDSGDLQLALSQGDFKTFVNGIGKALGRKGKRLFMPVRVALTGRMEGKDVGDVMALLDLAAAEGVPADKLVALDARMETLRRCRADALFS